MTNNNHDNNIDHNNDMEIISIIIVIDNSSEDLKAILERKKWEKILKKSLQSIAANLNIGYLIIPFHAI